MLETYEFGGLQKVLESWLMVHSLKQSLMMLEKFLFPLELLFT